jgi:hypothetical protein
VRQPVTLGARSAAETEVREGIAATDVVVTSNVAPDSRVRVREESRP